MLCNGTQESAQELAEVLAAAQNGKVSNTARRQPAPIQPASMEILELCTNLANRAAHVAEYVNGKLHPVMNSSPPATGAPANNTREYPPLFSDLRTSLMSISGSLDAINSALDRAEL
jgi:hypothetical protein